MFESIIDTAVVVRIGVALVTCGEDNDLQQILCSINPERIVGWWQFNRVRGEGAMLNELQMAYDEALIATQADPAAAKSLRPFSGFFSRLMAGFFLPEPSTDPSIAKADAITLVRLAESIADVEYAIRTHEDFKQWFGKWLKFPIVISFVLYALMFVHVYYAVYFGLRWFE